MPTPAERVTADLEALRRLSGAADGSQGVHRLAYSPGDMAVRHWFRDRARAAGLHAEIDPLGNVFGWSRAPNPGSRAAVALGSHLDSVPDGGNYDGALGALCALEAARRILERGADLSRPIVVIGLAAEESIRFGTACLGSRAIVGEISPDQLLALVDREGIGLGQALETAGLAPLELARVYRPPGWASAFLEVHMDQGPALHERGVPLGVITAIAGPTRHHLTFTGETMHSGGAAARFRRDALAGAAELVLKVEAIGQRLASAGLVATVGQVQVRPNLMTAVPGWVELGIDVRSPSRDLTWATWNEIWQAAQEMAQRRRLQAEQELVWSTDPVQVPSEMVELLSATCAELGTPYEKMVSGAAHDAMQFAREMPVGMLFVRNPTGVSHNAAEYVSPEDIEAAVRVLTAAVLKLAQAGSRSEL